MGSYFVTKALVGHAVEDRKIVTISAGSVVQSVDPVQEVGLTTISWSNKRVAVFVQDFVERVEPLPENGGGCAF
jgi:hypothetical protein